MKETGTFLKYSIIKINSGFYGFFKQENNELGP